MIRIRLFFFFFFNDTATTEIYTLSLHDALPILFAPSATPAATVHKLTEDFQATLNTPDIRSKLMQSGFEVMATDGPDRKSTRLNSSHSQISYAVFCLKKKKISKYLLSSLAE